MTEEPSQNPDQQTFSAGIPDDDLQQAADAARHMVEGPEEANPETQILEKGPWHEAHTQAFAEAKEQGLFLSTLIMDLDRFKAVNDEVGHVAGDEFIAASKRIVGRVAETLRTKNQPGNERPLDAMSVSEIQDVPDAAGGHFGGDEFTMYCFTDAAGAKVIADRLKEIFDEEVSKPGNEALKEIGVTASIGMSTYNPAEQPDQTATDELRIADRNLYKNKLENLPEISHEQWEAIEQMQKLLAQHNMRLRDVHKYVELAEVMKTLQEHPELAE